MYAGFLYVFPVYPPLKQDLIGGLGANPIFTLKLKSTSKSGGTLHPAIIEIHP